jgi:hypothetical protein
LHLVAACGIDDDLVVLGPRFLDDPRDDAHGIEEDVVSDFLEAHRELEDAKFFRDVERASLIGFRVQKDKSCNRVLPDCDHDGVRLIPHRGDLQGANHWRQTRPSRVLVVVGRSNGFFDPQGVDGVAQAGSVRGSAL